MIKLLEQQLQEIYEEKYSKEYVENLDLNPKIKFIPLVYDQMFKKVFGNNVPILKRFLIKVLHFDISEDACNIQVGPNELPKENKKNYASRVDINIVLNEQIRINLEVNQERFEDIADRNFLFATKEHTLNVKKGTKYNKFYEYETIQLNLNTYHYGTEKNGEDTFYIKSENTGNKLVKNFKIIIKDLAYFYDLYYTENGNIQEDQIWLAMLMSKNFTELASFLEILLNKEEKDKFLKEVISMSENVFFMNQWEPEAMRQIVEGRKKYNEEQRKKEIEQLENKVEKDKNELEKDKNELEKGKSELEKGKSELEKGMHELEKRKQEVAKEKEKIKKREKQYQEKKLKLEEEKIILETKEEELVLKFIKTLINKNISYEEIKEITNKSIDEIKEIEKNMKN